jgi:hypothetical protein
VPASSAGTGKDKISAHLEQGNLPANLNTPVEILVRTKTV